MIVSTAIYGGYDTLKPIADHPAVDDWICYTDNPDIENHFGWTVVVEDLGFDHPRVAAKWRKCNPPPADQSVWVDGSVSIVNPGFFDHVLRILEDNDMALLKHPDRDNIQDEADASFQVEWKKYAGLPLQPQVTGYLKRKPELKGLFQTTVFARNHTTNVIQMGARWFAHCELLTYQDQLSLPVMLDDYEVTHGEISGLPFDNPWWRWHEHARSD